MTIDDDFPNELYHEWANIGQYNAWHMQAKIEARIPRDGIIAKVRGRRDSTKQKMVNYSSVIPHPTKKTYIARFGDYPAEGKEQLPLSEVVALGYLNYEEG